MRSKIISGFFISLFFLLLSACSGSGGGDKTITGQFVDDPVQGMNYSCSSGASGVTNANGEYVCNAGDQVTFSLEGLEIGTVPAQSFVTPYTLFPGDATAAVNLARLLQSIDLDGNPTNGVNVIDIGLVAQLPPLLDFSSPTFREEIENTLGITLISAELAQTQLNDAIFRLGGEIPDGQHTPVANAGADQNVATSISVTLDGSASSDEDGDTLSYAWSLFSGPAGSAAVLSSPANVSTTFVADLNGEYIFDLVVSDGVLSHSDRVKITAMAPSSNADLSALQITSGTLSPVFNAATTSYAAAVGNAVSTINVIATVADAGATLTVSGTAQVSGASKLVSLNIGSNTIPVVVTAADGVTLKTYTVVITRAAASNNATLSALQISQGTLTPAFSSATTSYAATVGNSVTTINVTPTVSDTGASVSMFGSAITSGSSQAVSLIVGANSIPVVVTAADGVTTKTYTVTVTRAAISTNADLSSLQISQGTLTPAFNSATTSYTATVINAVATINVTPTVADAGASVTVSGAITISGSAKSVSLAVGANSIPVVVTAEDGVTTKTYTMTVTRAGTGGLPSVPQNLTNTSSGDSVIELSWDTVAGADNYTLYWTDTGVFSQGGSIVVGNVTQYTHSGLTNGTKYYYRVTANNSQGESDFSAVISATPDIPLPQNLQATAGDGSVDLAWNLVASGTYTFTVYWNTTGNVTTADNSIAAGSNQQITHSGLTAGSVYYYRVSATGISGEGELSDTVASAQNTTWTWVNPQPQGNSFNDVAHNDSLFVAVGSQGIIFTSADGQNWTPRNSGTIEQLSVVVWNGSQFLVSGSAGSMLRSSDGLTWTVSPSGITASDMLWDGSQYVAAGTAGKISTSPDGLNWTSRVSGAGNFDSIRYISWNGSQYVAYLYPDTLLTSPDSITWTMHENIVNNLVGLVWNGSQFLTMGGTAVYTSVDGLTWQNIGSADNSQLWTIMWDGTQYVGGGASGMVATSPDGLSWTTQTSNATETIWNIDFNGTRYVAVGLKGTLVSSLDGNNWITQLPTAVVTSSDWSDVIWDGSKFLALGQTTGSITGAIYSSPDGISWTLVFENSKAFKSIASDGSQFVAVGFSGNIVTSSNGVDWTSRTSGTSQTLYSVVWDGSRFVVVGSWGTILTSTNGTNWTAQTSGTTESLQGIEWDGSLFVAVGTKGKILTSPDATTWTSQTSGAFQTLNDIVWSGVKFLVAGQNNTLLTSSDGITWTSQTIGNFGHYQMAQWNGSEFVTSYDGFLYTSPDGVDWTAQTTGSSTIKAVAWNQATVIAVGSGGTILTRSGW
jgi:hypothetical protein